MKYKLLSALLFTCFALNAQAQKVAVEPVTIINYSKQPFNIELQKKMFQSMQAQDYPQLFSQVYELKNTKIDYIEYLHNLKFYGHPPIYWLMSDYYTSINNPLEAHKWLYAAIITTQQDASVCLDSSAMFATQRISNFFPEVRTLTSRTPQLIDKAMKDVVFFVQNLKDRPNPVWACYYGTIPNSESQNKKIPELIDKKFWEEKRSEIFKKYTSNYGK